MCREQVSVSRVAKPRPRSPAVLPRPRDDVGSTHLGALWGHCSGCRTRLDWEQSRPKQPVRCGAREALRPTWFLPNYPARPQRNLRWRPPRATVSRLRTAERDVPLLTHGALDRESPASKGPPSLRQPPERACRIRGERRRRASKKRRWIVSAPPPIIIETIGAEGRFTAFNPAAVNRSRRKLALEPSAARSVSAARCLRRDRAGSAAKVSLLGT